MKKIVLAACMLYGIVLLHACKSSSPASGTAKSDNSMTSLDWNGTYYGMIPCADCEGIETSLTLNNDLTYTKKTRYKGKGDGTVYESSGTFAWNKDGNKVSLSKERPSDFFVGENQVTQADMSGNRITGNLAANYVLRKQSTSISNKYWKLTELNGKPVTMQEGQRRETHMILRSEGNRVNGNGGCNTFNGTYELKEKERISFSKMATTMMACPNLDAEAEFMKVLEMADSYYLKGDTLILNKGRMAPLARFVAVYFQ